MRLQAVLEYTDFSNVNETTHQLLVGESRDGILSLLSGSILHYSVLCQLLDIDWMPREQRQKGEH
jgi:hypothetical protein